MIRPVLGITVALALIGGQANMANSSQIQFLDTIQGSSFLAIQAVMGIFQRHNPDLTLYKIEVVREGNTVVVILVDKDEPASTRENLGVRLESKLELSAQDLSILRSTPGQIHLLDRIQGSSFLAIQAAMTVFQRHNPDLAQYKIEVVREGASRVVIFADKDRPEGTRGSVGKPGFEVELNAQDLRVLRSNFVR
jgi:hypothetical protein